MIGTTISCQEIATGPIPVFRSNHEKSTGNKQRRFTGTSLCFCLLPVLKNGRAALHFCKICILTRKARIVKMLPKKINEAGQKAYQRSDYEDRSLGYRLWLRGVKTEGFYLDVDMIKWKNVDGQLKPVAITELTRCDRDDIGWGYLHAIEDRWFRRDVQGRVFQTLGDMLDVPVYIVCVQKDNKWFYVYSFRRREWKKYLPDEWAEYLKTL